VGITRAQDELVLTYPLTIQRAGRGPLLLTRRSRFIDEIEPALFESAVVESHGERVSGEVGLPDMNGEYDGN
jgi:superfamily I DNA/RNA helicase